MKKQQILNPKPIDSACTACYENPINVIINSVAPCTQHTTTYTLLYLHKDNDTIEKINVSLHAIDPFTGHQWNCTINVTSFTFDPFTYTLNCWI